jgi:hypothetical protein
MLFMIGIFKLAGIPGEGLPSTNSGDTAVSLASISCDGK